MNLKQRVEQLEKVRGDTQGAKLPPGFVLTAEEHAALALSASTYFTSIHDAEYGPRAEAFMDLYVESLPPRQIDPAEIMRAMRNTVRGDASGIAADRQRYRALIDSVFERCGFNPMLAGA